MSTANKAKVTYGKTYAIGMPSVVVKDCEGVFLNGKEVGGIWWMGSLDSATPYHPVVNKVALGKFATEKEAKDAVEKHLVDSIETECDSNPIKTEEGKKMVKVDMVNKVYESKSGEVEGRVVTFAGGWVVETRTKEVSWNTLETDGEHFSNPMDACNALEEILNAN